eukprot:528163_1
MSDLVVNVAFGMQYKETLYRLSSCQNKKETIIICGGYGHENDSDPSHVWEYNVKLRKYLQLPSMPETVCNHHIFKTNDKLLVIGFRNKYMLVFDMKNNKWSKLDISVTIGQALCCKTDTDSIHLLPCGQSMHFMLNTTTFKIIQLTNTPFIATGGGYLVYHNLKLYAIIVNSKEIHIYDIVSSEWTKGAAPPNISNHYFGCVKYKHYIVTVGGLGTGMNDKVNIYDIKTDKWFTSKIKLPIQLWALTATIINNEIHTFGGYSISHLNKHMIITLGGDVNEEKIHMDEEKKDVFIEENPIRKCVNILSAYGSFVSNEYSLDKLTNVEFHQLMSLKNKFNENLQILDQLEAKLHNCKSIIEDAKLNVDTLTLIDVEKYQEWSLEDICNYAMSICMQNEYVFGSSTINKLRQAGIESKDLPDLDRSDIREYFGIISFQDSKTLHACFQKLNDTK